MLRFLTLLVMSTMMLTMTVPRLIRRFRSYHRCGRDDGDVGNDDVDGDVLVCDTSGALQMPLEALMFGRLRAAPSSTTSSSLHLGALNMQGRPPKQF